MLTAAASTASPLELCRSGNERKNGKAVLGQDEQQSLLRVGQVCGATQEIPARLGEITESPRDRNAGTDYPCEPS